jgi:hypothetical protein
MIRGSILEEGLGDGGLVETTMEAIKSTTGYSGLDTKFII